MRIPQPLQEEFTVFVLTVPAKRLKQNTLRILMYFLTKECAEGTPAFMKDALPDLAAFFELLDLIDKEIDQSGLY